MNLVLVGQRLRKLRGDTPLYIVAAEVKRTSGVNINPRTLELYEKGKVEPSFVKLDAVARYYGVTTDWLGGRLQPQVSSG